MKIILLRLLIYVVRLSFVGILLQGLLFNLLIAGNIEAQKYASVKDVVIKIDVKNASVIQLFNELEQKTEFHFTYDEYVVSNNKAKISISGRQKSVEEILLHVSEQAKLRFKQINNNINVSPLKDKSEEKTIEVLIQGIIITGKVTSAEDESGLPGVNVIVKGTSVGTVTDVEGRYKLEILDETSVLVFSSVGFMKEEVAVGNQTVIDVVLNPDITALEEIVVIGYGTQKKVNLTGAIGMASGEVLENRPTINVLEGLQGVIPGLNITNADGNPGGSPKINIRGATSLSGGSPLVLVDGAQMDINQLNPDDIENVTVLKDAASSAIYGARAAYGVILITTKSGKRNTKTKVTYNGNFYIAQPTIVPNTANSYKFALYVNEMRKSDNLSTTFTDEHLALLEATVAGSGINFTEKPDGSYYEHSNTNWADLVFDDAAPGQQHYISVAGGSEKTGYHVSLAYADKNGVVKIGGDKYQRFNFNTKLDIDITNWLTSYIQVNLSKEKTNIFQQSNNVNSIFHTVWRAQPHKQPTFEKDGIEYNVGHLILNPVKTLEHGGRNENSMISLNTKAGIKMTFGKFNVFSNFTYRPGFNESVKNNKPIEGIYLFKPGTQLRTFNEPSWVKRENINSAYNAFDAYGQYENTFSGKHYIKAMLGYNQEWQTSSRLYGFNRYLISPDIISLSNSTGDPTVADSFNQWALRSGFARINYIYKDKYLLEVNGRYDGSSRFSKDDRFGFFPSVSGGWRISEEPFFSDVSFIDNLKLRASYGSLGNQNTGLYPVSTYRTTSEVPYMFDGARPIGIRPGNPLGDKRTWETVSTVNFGIDITLLQRLDLSFDAYRRTTEDMLVSGNALPGVYGASAPQENAANLEVNGWEASIAWRDRISDNLTYNIGFVMADWKGEITKFDNPTKSLAKSYYEGQIIGEIWGYETVGLFQTQEEIDNAPDHSSLGAGNLMAIGDVQYADLNNDGKISVGENTVDNPGDLKIIGNRTPRYSYSIHGGIGWKGFDFSFFFQGVAKRDFWLHGPVIFGGFGGTGQVTVTDLLYDNVWSDGTSGIPENRDAFYFRPCERKVMNRNAKVQTRYLQNAAYLRLKNLQIGYTLPSSISQKMHISNFRIYVSGENLITFTKLNPSFDPEVLVPNEASQGQVRDKKNETTWQGGKAYPLTKRLSFGINMSF